MNFDLNTNNYNIEELIQMFELPPQFDKNIVEIKEAKLRESILKNNQINYDTKEKLYKIRPFRLINKDDL